MPVGWLSARIVRARLEIVDEVDDNMSGPGLSRELEVLRREHVAVEAEAEFHGLSDVTRCWKSRYFSSRYRHDAKVDVLIILNGIALLSPPADRSMAQFDMLDAPYRDATLPVEQRVADLLARMTLEEKAAQMTCVWQQKATKLLDEAGNFDLAKARENFGHGHGLGQVGRPSDAGGGKNARRDGRAHQRDPEVLHRGEPAGHPGRVSRRVPARPGGGRRDQLFAADRLGGDVRPRPGRAAVHDDGGRGPRRAARTRR